MSYTVTYTVNSTGGDDAVRITYTLPNRAIVTTPFPSDPKLVCDVCGREYKPSEGGWISIHRNRSGVIRSYNLCQECLEQIAGMVGMLVKVLKGGKK